MVKKITNGKVQDKGKGKQIANSNTAAKKQVGKVAGKAGGPSQQLSSAKSGGKSTGVASQRSTAFSKPDGRKRAATNTPLENPRGTIIGISSVANTFTDSSLPLSSFESSHFQNAQVISQCDVSQWDSVSQTGTPPSLSGVPSLVSISTSVATRAPSGRRSRAVSSYPLQDRSFMWEANKYIRNHVMFINPYPSPQEHEDLLTAAWKHAVLVNTLNTRYPCSAEIRCWVSEYPHCGSCSMANRSAAEQLGTIVCKPRGTVCAGAKKNVAQAYGLDSPKSDPEIVRQKVEELLLKDNFIYLGDGVEV